MKCTDYNNLYLKIEQLEYQELAGAVEAHGGEYIFFDCSKDGAVEEWENRDNYDDIPHISGGNQCNSINTDFYVTRVKLYKVVGLTIYGFCQEYGDPSMEDVITYVEYGYVGCITEQIPETEDVKDVSFKNVTLKVDR